MLDEPLTRAHPLTMEQAYKRLTQLHMCEHTLAFLRAVIILLCGGDGSRAGKIFQQDSVVVGTDD